MKVFKILLTLALSLTFLLNNVKALADSPNPEATAQKVEQAADKIVQEDQKESAKEVFGTPEKNGAEIIDKARSKAQDKLKSMAKEVRKEKNSDSSLSASQKDFLKKF